MAGMKSKRDPDIGNAHEVPGAQALLRGIDLLLAIGTASTPPRFRDLERAVNIPRASLHRMLAALASRNLIRYDERARTYEVGMRILDLSRRTLDKSGIMRAAKPEVSRLARRLQRTICLLVLDGNDVFVLDFEDFDSALSRLVRHWPRARAVDTAAGRALLAAMPRDKSEGLLRGTEVADQTDLQNFLAGLSITKALGYAAMAREPGRGQASVAAPVFDETGYPLAAIAVFFEPDQMSSEDLHEAGRIIAEGARRASGHLRIGFPTPTIKGRPASSIGEGVETLPTGRDFVGENPVWNARRRRLYWVDVLAPALRWWEPASRTSGRVQLPHIVAGLVFDANDRLIVAGEKGLCILDAETGEATPLIDPEADRRDNRFNTATTDDRGRIWSATVAINHEIGKGSLYSVDADLTVRRHRAEAGTPKTLAFDAGNQRIYLIDSSNYTVYWHGYDPEGGRLLEGHVFVRGDVSSQPSGITVDAENQVWITFLGGWCVRRYRAEDAALVEEHSLPVPMPTHCAFGGEDLSTLFVTSTWLRLPPGLASAAPASGQLIALRTTTRGRLAHPAR